MMEDISEIPYYHGSLSRDDAESLLMGKEDGMFLLRKSTRHTNAYVISVTFQKECLHYSVSEVKRDGRTMFSVNTGRPFPTPWEVCQHYMNTKSGLRVQLQYPLLKYPESDSPYLVETSWFHGEITRVEDSCRLSQGFQMNHNNGTFLIRKKEDSMYCLSLVNAGRIHRYIINQDPSTGHFYIQGKNNTFISLNELVEFNSSNPPAVTGIQCQLTTPCPKTFGEKKIPSLPPRPAQKKSLVVPSLALELEKLGLLAFRGSDIPDEISRPNQNKRWTVPWMQEFSTTSKSTPEKCPGYHSIYQNLARKKGEVALDLYVEKKNICIYEEIGKGHFGKVCLGRCQIVGKNVTCAIKFLKGEDILANKKELLTEAGIMQTLDHPHIIRLIALCDTDSDLMILLEFAPLGPLKDFLRSQTDNAITEVQLLRIMKQVLDGMVYLASKNVVHRDLAARNILLVSENFAKVSDFGMSKVLHESENYYRSVKPGSWPLKWYSPEALCYYKFTSKCDVWSYGVTLWEAFSYGCQPYKGMKGKAILEMIEKNERLDCPITCPLDVYDMMLYCWTYDHNQRPDFKQLVPVMDSILKNAGVQKQRNASSPR